MSKNKDKKLSEQKEQFHQYKVSKGIFKCRNVSSMSKKRLYQSYTTKLLRTKENHDMVQKTTELRQTADKKIQYLNLNIQAIEQRLKSVYTVRNQLQTKNSNLQLKIKKLQKINEYLEIQKERDLQEFHKKITSEVQRYECYLNEYQTSINEHDSLTNQNAELKSQLTQQKQTRMQKCADLEREKIQALDSIKKQMAEKIREMKTNLLVMRRDQMATNTRLTVLQNNQLIQELEFQSKNTEKVLQKNNELQQKVKELTIQLEIQKQLQRQVANRANISKTIIGKLHNKNQQLEGQLGLLDKKIIETRDEAELRIKMELANKYDQTIIQLNTDLKKATKGLTESKARQQKIQNLYHKINNQLQKYQKQATDLLNILMRYYTEVIEGKVTIDQGEYVYDLARLKSVDVSQWKTEDLDITVKILLNFIKTRLSTKKLQVPYLKNILLSNENPLNTRKSSYSSHLDFKTEKHHNLHVQSMKTSLLPKNQLENAITDCNKMRNFSDIGKRIIGSQSLSSYKHSLNKLQKENSLTTKLVRPPTRKWRKPTQIHSPVSLVNRFYKHR